MAIHPFDYLTFLGEIAVTLIGFVAVFLVLSNREGRFDAADRHFIQAMVVSASLSIMLAIIPSVLSYFAFDASLWTAASLVAAVVGLPVLILQLKIQFSMSDQEAAKIHWGWHVTAWTMGGLAYLLVVAGSTTIADPATMFVSSASLLTMLALWSFIAVVFRKFF